MGARVLKTGKFPTIWKNAKLILIEKPKKDQIGQSTYRPLCLIDAAGKVLEMMLKIRIQAELLERNQIHEDQYGFTKGRSTVNAIEKIQMLAREIKQKANRHREMCLMILLDIKNAFNSAPWNGIVEALIDGGISKYLVKMIQSYLSDRKITAPRGETHNITCGVPQGSILGPTLWNVFYNKMLKIGREKGVNLVAYADDLAVIVQAKTNNELEEKSQHMVAQVIDTLEGMGIQIAPEKTETILIVGRRAVRNVQINIEGTLINTSEMVKYLE